MSLTGYKAVLGCIYHYIMGNWRAVIINIAVNSFAASKLHLWSVQIWHTFPKDENTLFRPVPLSQTRPVITNALICYMSSIKCMTSRR